MLELYSRKSQLRQFTKERPVKPVNGNNTGARDPVIRDGEAL